MALLHGQFSTAIYHNILSIPLALFLIAIPIWLLRDAIKQQDTLVKSLTTPWPPIYIVIAAVLALASWAWNIYKHLYLAS